MPKRIAGRNSMKQLYWCQQVGKFFLLVVNLKPVTFSCINYSVTVVVDINISCKLKYVKTVSNPQP